MVEISVFGVVYILARSRHLCMLAKCGHR